MAHVFFFVRKHEQDDEIQKRRSSKIDLREIMKTKRNKVQELVDEAFLQPLLFGSKIPQNKDFSSSNRVTK